MQFEKFCCYYSPQNHYLGINGVEMLTEQQLNSFNKNGFLVIDHVLDDEDLVPLEQEYNELLDTLATGLYREGKILDLVESLIGPEIASSPVQQMRIKPPQDQISDDSIAHSGVGNTTWHLSRQAIRMARINTYPERFLANRRCLPILSIIARVNPYL